MLQLMQWASLCISLYIPYKDTFRVGSWKSPFCWPLCPFLTLALNIFMDHDILIPLQITMLLHPQSHSDITLYIVGQVSGWFLFYKRWSGNLQNWSEFVQGLTSQGLGARDHGTFPNSLGCRWFCRGCLGHPIFPSQNNKISPVIFQGCLS